MYFLPSRIKILSSAGLIAKEEIKAIPWYLHQMVAQTTLSIRDEHFRYIYLFKAFVYIDSRVKFDEEETMVGKITILTCKVN